MKTRVAIWAAVSSKPQAAEDKTSLADQEHLGRQYAEKIGGEVVKIYKVPGHTRDIVFWQDAEKDMPAYQELRQDIETHSLDVLWVLDPDRLGRDPALSNQVVSLVEKAGATLHLASGDYSIDEDSTAHRYLFAIQAVRAGEDQRKRAYYRDMGIRARVKRGLPASNWPHGYRAVRDENGKTIEGEFVPGEIEAVRLATDLFLQGKGYYSIIKKLDASPWRPRKAERWSFSMVRGMLLNDVYAGYVSYGDARNSEPSDKFPAVWDSETYKAILREHQQRHRGGSKPASAASGCVICARCGWSMSISRRSGGRLFFRCSLHANQPGRQCHSNLIRESIIIEKVEAAIALRLRRTGYIDVTAALEHIGPGRATIEQEIASIQMHIETIEEKQYRLAILAEDGAIAIEAARRRTSELAELLAAKSQELRQAQEKLTTLPDPAEMRQRLEQVAQHVDLRSRPLEETRQDLLRAGVKVYVENRQITKIVFGELS